MADRLLYGPDGQVVANVDTGQRLVEQKTDHTITYARDGDSYTADPVEVLVKAARMQRDGASLKAIRIELDLHHSVSDFVLERALALGRQVLEERIRSGQEPAESITTELVPVEIDEQIEEA